MAKRTSGNMDAAFKHFKKVDPILYAAGKNIRAQLVARTPLRTKEKLFAALAESVVSQQLAVKAADAIWARVVAACGGTVTSESIRKTPLAKLRKAGLSGAKAKTLKELAKAVGKGLHLPALRRMTKDEAEETLTKVWGIGPWTCEMFLMFALGHEDIFSARDLGLVRSMETLYGLKNPTKAQLEERAVIWSPHRTLACRILWRARDSG